MEPILMGQEDFEAAFDYGHAEQVELEPDDGRRADARFGRQLVFGAIKT